MNGLGQCHHCSSRSASQSTTKPFDVFKVVTEKEELSHGTTNNGGDDLAADGVSRLRKRRFNGVELKDGSSTLNVASLVSYNNHKMCVYAYTYTRIRTRYF